MFFVFLTCKYTDILRLKQHEIAEFDVFSDVEMNNGINK